MKSLAILFLTSLLAFAQDGRVAPRPEWASYLDSYSHPYYGPLPNPVVVEADAFGNTWIGGAAGFDDVPVTPDAPQKEFISGLCFGGKTSCPEGFLMKLDAQGRVLFATYIGGPDDDRVLSIVALPSGDIFVSGTGRLPFTTAGDPYGGWVARFAPDGKLRWSRRSDFRLLLALGPGGELFATANIPPSQATQLRLFDPAAPNFSISPPEWDSVTGHRSTPEVLFVSGSTGFYRSHDAGRTWTRLGEGAGSPRVHPADPNTLYGIRDYWLWVSNDAGATWRQLPRDPDMESIEQFYFDPGSPSTIYVKTGHWGIFRSDDAGMTWQRTGLSQSPADTSRIFVDWLLADPRTQGVVLAYAFPGGLRRSTDRGATWELLDRNGVSGAAADAAGTLYLIEGPDVLTSTDSGRTWSRFENTLARYAGLRNLVADPIRPGVLYGLSASDFVLVSVNGGQTWSEATHLSGGSNVNLFTGLGRVLVTEAMDVGNVRVARLDPSDGHVLWQTDFGGTGGERPLAIAADPSKVWVAGATSSGDFPTRNANQPRRAGLQDGFVAAFSTESGELLESTYSGTPSNDTVEAVRAGAGRVYAAHSTVELSSHGMRHSGWISERLSGRTIAELPHTLPSAIDVAVNGDVWISGTAYEGGLASADAFARGFSGVSDAFLARLAPSGEKEYFTYYGGSADDTATALRVAPEGDVLAAGTTLSPDLPLVRPFQPQSRRAWVARWTARPQPDPALPDNGIVNGLSFTGGIAPGGIVSLFGTDLARGVAHALALPLPPELLDTSVTFDGIPARLFYVSPQQINAQVPWSVQAGQAVVQVRRGSAVAAERRVEVRATAPALWQGAVDAVGSVLGDLFQAGQRVTLYATGLGALQHAVEDGAAADGINWIAAPLSVAIGDVPVTVEYAGGAPGFAGLYQINVVMPQRLMTGMLTITAGGALGNSFEVSVVE